jgi:hypothetical protein
VGDGSQVGEQRLHLFRVVENSTDEFFQLPRQWTNNGCHRCSQFVNDQGEHLRLGLIGLAYLLVEARVLDADGRIVNQGQQ